MKVALDGQLAVGTATGIGEYIRGLEPALASRGVDVRMLQAVRLDPWRFDRRVLWDQVLLPFAAARSGGALLHCTSGTLPLVPLAMPIVVTVHDAAWLRVQSHTRPYARFYFGGLMLRRYGRARAILTDSEFSRDELLRLGVRKTTIFVAHLGVDPAFAAVERAPDRDRPTILAVGTVERRKALAVVIEAIAEIPAVRLVSVGPATPYLDECRRLATELGIADRVTFAGYVSRADLIALYSGATLAVAPSLYEGFGYAAAQALCAGVPLLASDASSHPEIVAGAAPLVAAGDVAAWRAAIRAALDDIHGARERAAAARMPAAARFTWDACARATIAAYDAALGAQ